MSATKRDPDEVTFTDEEKARFAAIYVAEGPVAYGRAVAAAAPPLTRRQLDAISNAFDGSDLHGGTAALGGVSAARRNQSHRAKHANDLPLTVE